MSPHRVRVKRGADGGETRFKGSRKAGFYKNVKEGEIGGGRTEFGVCPVRVWVERGAERPQTRLRGRWGGGSEKSVFSSGEAGGGWLLVL